MGGLIERAKATDLPAVSATASATAVSTTATATAATRAFTWCCFIHANHSPHPFNVLKIVNRFLFVCIVCHLNESKTTLAPRLSIEREAACLDFAVLAEQVEQVLLFRLEREVAYVNGHS